MAQMTYRQALHDTLREELQRDENVLLMGEEIGNFEGSYKITAGLLKEFGPRRVVERWARRSANGMMHGAAGVNDCAMMRDDVPRHVMCRHMPMLYRHVPRGGMHRGMCRVHGRRRRRRAAHCRVRLWMRLCLRL